LCSAPDLAANPITTVVLERDGQEVGYAELINREGDVEILSFGLREAFIGKGVGSAALDLVVRCAWTLGAVHHVWLHTCEKDHPNALRTYERRGFVRYDTLEETQSPFNSRL
jgi:GNAT superfamily N-acetyltransferase